MERAKKYRKGSVQFSFRIPEEYMERIIKISEETNRSKSDIVWEDILKGVAKGGLPEGGTEVATEPTIKKHISVIDKDRVQLVDDYNELLEAAIDVIVEFQNEPDISKKLPRGLYMSIATLASNCIECK